MPGIHQTLWTPQEGIWSVVFGVHHFHGSFHLIPVVGGIVGHLGSSLILGSWAFAADRDPRSPTEPRRAVVLGAAYGIAVEAIPINGIVNTQRSRPSKLDASLELVGRPRVLRRDVGLLSSVLLEKQGAPRTMRRNHWNHGTTPLRASEWRPTGRRGEAMHV